MTDKENDADDNDLDTLYRAVGFIVVQWGQAEQTLDMIVAIIFQDFGGNKIEKQIPIMLKQKIKYLRKCFNKIPDISDCKTTGNELLDQFKKLSEKRNEIIHGAVSTTTSNNGAYSFAKIDIINEYHHVREFDFEINQFPKLSEDLVKLGSNAVKLANQLLQINQ
ncbi:MAG: hypothetical protein OEY89_15670 [Gammaproteobacteria bacterium]|nr:hypothetical protein [Gammaproteobacteria bacterium]